MTAATATPSRTGTSRWSLAAAVLLTLAVVAVLAPTYPMTWTTLDASTDVFGTTTSWHSWFDPIIIGYGGVQAPVAAVSAVVAAGLSWAGVLRGSPSRAAAPWASVALGLALLGALVFSLWAPLLAAPLVPLLVGTVCAWLARRSHPVASST